MVNLVYLVICDRVGSSEQVDMQRDVAGQEEVGSSFSFCYYVLHSVAGGDTKVDKFTDL